MRKKTLYSGLRTYPQSHLRYPLGILAQPQKQKNSPGSKAGAMCSTETQNTFRNLLTYSMEYDIIIIVKRGTPLEHQGGKDMNAMTDKQLQFIAWLITTATDKCKDMDEVRKMNEEIRRHSAGIKDEAESEN